MVATAIYSVTMVLWKETAFPLCTAILLLLSLLFLSLHSLYYPQKGIAEQQKVEKRNLRESKSHLYRTGAGL